MLAAALSFALLMPGAPQLALSGELSPVVHVAGERLLLGTLVPRTPEPWASIDLGPAPQPLQRRLLTRRQLDARLRLAQLGASPVPLPGRIEVVRCGQRLSEPRLRRLVRQQVEARLPPGSALRTLRLEGGLVLPEGVIGCDIPSLSGVRAGRQTVLATVRSDGAAGTSTQVRVPVLLEVAQAPQPETAVIQRGQPVNIVVHAGAVRLQSTGIAQLAGRVGEAIAVLPTGGTRVLHGQIRDGRTVEVTP